jgi:DNA polymerase type B, organellar and viral
MAGKPRNFTTTEKVRAARRAEGRPFMGVDGEGCGVDRWGRQHYMLLRCGPSELFTGKPLTTGECLDFICSAPADHILVGYAFGYDVTQILRDLSAERLARLFADREAGEGLSRYVYWTDYAIEYLPRNYLRVARLTRRWIVREDGSHGWLYERIEGSTRTIWEVFGFFQCSFVKAIHDFDVGARHWPAIERQKRKRSKFVRITREIRVYCELECVLLAAMMEKFRLICHDVGIHPSQWAGAGKLAAYLHRANNTITRAALDDRLTLSPELALYANDAYYGGRFEITRVGDIGPCHEADLRSAYPAAMLSLPCLEHGTWQRVTPAWLSNAAPEALYVSKVTFVHPEGTPLCGLPVRHKQGHLCWPREGGGTYWSCEIRSAETLGARIVHESGWRYISHCKCEPFAWVSALYKERLRLGKGTKGYPIKLALNSLYGKLAQRIGNPRYGNFIWAGLITALTRARLNETIALDPGGIVMLATDAVISRRPLALDHSEALGAWESKSFDSLFVVQPGLYWDGHRAGNKRKTRGTATSVFARHMHRFEKTWRAWCESGEPAMPYRIGSAWKRTVPSVSIVLTLFVGLKLAHARSESLKEPEDKARALFAAGSWPRVRREFSFEWGRKRAAWPVVRETPTCLLTYPLAGGPDFISMPHKGNMARLAELDMARLEYQDQPDGVVDMSPP